MSETPGSEYCSCDYPCSTGQGLGERCSGCGLLVNKPDPRGMGEFAVAKLAGGSMEGKYVLTCGKFPVAYGTAERLKHEAIQINAAHEAAVQRRVEERDRYWAEQLCASGEVSRQWKYIAEMREREKEKAVAAAGVRKCRACHELPAQLCGPCDSKAVAALKQKADALAGALKKAIEVGEDVIAQETAGGKHTFFDEKHGWSEDLKECSEALAAYEKEST